MTQTALPLPVLASSQPSRRVPLLSVAVGALAEWLRERGYASWYAGVVRRWVLGRRATDFAAMSDLPKALRQQLADSFQPLGLRVARDHRSVDGTRKLLVRLWDGADVECVLIPDLRRRTACISTQVGCGMGCVFCASGLNGVQRNLEPGEIVEQLVLLRNLLPPGERLTNVVVMGMGEPLANLDHLLAALEDATAATGLGIGARHITISTVGLPARIRRLADADKQYHLAVSLHAPNDALRTRIVPTNAKTGLPEIVAAADYFYAKTGRQVTYEYVLLRDLNDGPLEAAELARLLQGRGAHINLIPFNPVEGLPYQRPTDAAISQFTQTLRQAGLFVHVRRKMGGDIAAACGQLRRQVQAAGQASTVAPAAALAEAAG